MENQNKEAIRQLLLQKYSQLFSIKKLRVKKLFDRSRHLYSSDTPVLSLKRIKLTKTTGATIALFNYRKIVLVDNWEIHPTTFGTVSLNRSSK
jgi:hypothetical protein